MREAVEKGLHRVPSKLSVQYCITHDSLIEVADDALV